MFYFMDILFQQKKGKSDLILILNLKRVIIESPYAGDIEISKVKELIKQYALEVIGHTPWDLPIASPYKGVREAAFVEYLKCLDVFSKLGVPLVNVHPFLSQDMGSDLEDERQRPRRPAEVMLMRRRQPEANSCSAMSTANGAPTAQPTMPSSIPASVTRWRSV